MNLTIVGSRYFGATVFEALRKESGVQIVSATGNIAPQSGSAAGHGFSASDILIVMVFEPADR